MLEYCVKDALAVEVPKQLHDVHIQGQEVGDKG